MAKHRLRLYGKVEGALDKVAVRSFLESQGRAEGNRSMSLTLAKGTVARVVAAGDSVEVDLEVGSFAQTQEAADFLLGIQAVTGCSMHPGQSGEPALPREAYAVWLASELEERQASDPNAALLLLLRALGLGVVGLPFLIGASGEVDSIPVLAFVVCTGIGVVLMFHPAMVLDFGSKNT